MNLHSMKLPDQLEDIARWFAEDGHEEDALHSDLTGHQPAFAAAVAAPAPMPSSLYDFDFSAAAPPAQDSEPQRFALVEESTEPSPPPSSSARSAKERNSNRTLIKIACGVVASLLVFVLAVMALPPLFGVGLFVQHDENMLPRFNVGTVAVYRPRAFEDIPINADIVFATSEAYVQSRVIRRNDVQNLFIAQGISSREPATFVYYANVRGQTLFGIPMLGYVVQWLLPTLNQVIIAAALAALLAMLIILSRKRPKPAAPKAAEVEDILDDSFFAMLGIA